MVYLFINQVVLEQLANSFKKAAWNICSLITDYCRSPPAALMRKLTSCSNSSFLVNNYMRNDDYILSLVCVFITCTDLKRQFCSGLTADPSSSFKEAVDKLIQHILVDKCMKHDINTVCIYCPFSFNTIFSAF